MQSGSTRWSDKVFCRCFWCHCFCLSLSLLSLSSVLLFLLSSSSLILNEAYVPHHFLSIGQLLVGGDKVSGDMYPHKKLGPFLVGKTIKDM